MATHPSSTLSFETFLRQVTRVREAIVAPAGVGPVREAGVEPTRLLERIGVVERIGAAMTAADVADPVSLTVGDRERVARSSGVSVAEVDDLLARFGRAIGDADST